MHNYNFENSTQGHSAVKPLYMLLDFIIFFGFGFQRIQVYAFLIHVFIYCYFMILKLN